jgi:cation diffusion facilitator CzcD-associated flavoprotein CzcO
MTHELAVTLRALDIPEEWTHEILRRQYISQYHWLAQTSLEAPDELHTFLIESMRPLLPEGFDIDKHFTPRYRPWQQRIAVVPDGDLFAALREGKASIVTDTIEAFTEHGVKVSSGEEIPADIVVTPPASTCRPSVTSRSPSTASRSTSPNASPGAAS